MKTYFLREAYSKRRGKKKRVKQNKKENEVSTIIVPQIQKTYLKVAGQLFAYITLGILVFSTIK